MSEVQRHLETVVEIGEAQQPPSDQAWNRYNSEFHQIYECIKRGELPIVVGLGHRDGYKQICEKWSFLPGENRQMRLPTGKKEPVFMLQNEHGTLAIQTCEPNYKRPPFEFVEYSQAGDRRFGITLPQRPPINQRMPLREPVVSKYGAIGAIEVLEYDNHRQAILGRYVDDQDPDDYAKISVNIPEAPLPDGYFWLKTWMENEELAKDVVEAGLVKLTGRYCENRNVTAVEAYLNYAKLTDVPFIQGEDLRGD